jgi:phage shock protein PspC (stress-responsive transcriptional regulator)
MAASRAGGKTVIMNTAPYPEPETTEASQRPRQLYRPVDDRMLAGVASGLARYLRVDAMLVRVALVVLCFVGGIGVPVYLASWLLLPEESPDGGAGHSIAADFTQSMQDWRN